MSTVAQVIRDKSAHDIYSIPPSATVLEAITLMTKKGIGAVVVLDESQKVVGIISERDYMRKVVLMKRKSSETTVADIMTKNVLSVTPSNTVDECLALMTERHIRHLPVVADDELVGFISIGDLVKAAMEDQRQLIEQLQQYISG